MLLSVHYLESLIIIIIIIKVALKCRGGFCPRNKELNYQQVADEMIMNGEDVMVNVS